MTTFKFTGIDYHNPLGVLASFGAFRLVCVLDDNASMAWIRSNNGWTPAVNCSISQDEFSIALHNAMISKAVLPDCLVVKTDKGWIPARNPRVSPWTYYKSSVVARDSGNELQEELMAALGTNGIYHDETTCECSKFVITTGGSSRHFLEAVRNCMALATPEKISDTLFNAWRRPDPGNHLTLMLDPSDCRLASKSFALLENVPLPNQAVANALAFVGLSLLPSLPIGGANQRVATVGMGENGEAFTWPIWQASLSLVDVRSLMALGELQHDNLNHKRLSARGISDVFRSKRCLLQKGTQYFTQGTQV